MSTALAFIRQLLACFRGSFSVQYSSLALLVAIAAIVIFTQLGGVAGPGTP